MSDQVGGARPLERPPWWRGLASASAEIPCTGAIHRLVWADGALGTPDHNDADAETALAALGGDPPACLAAVSAWRRQATDPALVTLGRRPGEPHLGLEARDPEVRWTPSSATNAMSASMSSRLGSKAIERMNREQRRRSEMIDLLSLPAPMIDRLVLTVLASCAERWPDEAFRAEHGLRLGAALSVRAMPALRRLGERLGAGVPEVGVSPLHPERVGTLIAARADGPAPVLSTELPVGWLTDVWGRGISEPDGEFVIDVRAVSDDGGEFEVFVAEWEAAGTLTWEAAPVPATIATDELGIRRVHRHW